MRRERRGDSKAFCVDVLLGAVGLGGEPVPGNIFTEIAVNEESRLL